jgi:hypothetical protein
MSKKQKEHFEVLIRFYGGREELIKRFGVENPSLQDRTAYFNELWEKYEHEINLNDLDLKASGHEHLVSYLRTKFGAFEIIKRGNRLRFHKAEDALFVKMRYMKTSRS